MAAAARRASWWRASCRRGSLPAGSSNPNPNPDANPNPNPKGGALCQLGVCLRRMQAEAQGRGITLSP
eukprot:scaffold84498_cov75-Phaeocystis_antarctica.AAC.4